jgi:myosin heavy subunit
VIADRDRHRVRNALSVLGIGPEEDIWAVVAAVLHMGNIRFAPQGDGSVVVNTDCTFLSSHPIQ